MTGCWPPHWGPYGPLSTVPMYIVMFVTLAAPLPGEIAWDGCSPAAMAAVSDQ